MAKNAHRSEYDDLFFRSTVESYVSHDKNPRFLRRDWLADEVARTVVLPANHLIALGRNSPL